MSGGYTIHILYKNNNLTSLTTIINNQLAIIGSLVPLNRTDDMVTTTTGEYDQYKFVRVSIPEDETVETNRILMLHKHDDLDIAAKECLQTSSSLSFRVDIRVLWNLQDIMDLDDMFLNTNYRRGVITFKYNGYVNRCIVLYRRGRYLGHVWYFTKPGISINTEGFCGIYAMRTSVVNLLVNNSIGDDCPLYRRSIGYKLLNAVEELARSERRSYIIVPKPSKALCHILTRRGYDEVNADEMVAERRFLSGIDDATNLFIKEVRDVM